MKITFAKERKISSPFLCGDLKICLHRKKFYVIINSVDNQRKKEENMEEKVPVVNFEDYTCRNVAIDSGFKCSECKAFVESNDYAGSAYICDGDWNFCPNCGRKVID